MMRLALFTGMRRSEMLKLKWEHINFERNFITIKDPKGGQDAVIPLNDAARAALLSMPRVSDSPFVFPGRQGKARTDIHKATRAIADAAGLPKDFRPLHGLRHYFATTLASSGKVDLYHIQQLLTHKSSAMTQRYAKIRNDALREASNVISETLPG